MNGLVKGKKTQNQKVDVHGNNNVDSG
jgi:hypothetical protein